MHQADGTWVGVKLLRSRDAHFTSPPEQHILPLADVLLPELTGTSKHLLHRLAVGVFGHPVVLHRVQRGGIGYKRGGGGGVARAGLIYDVSTRSRRAPLVNREPLARPHPSLQPHNVKAKRRRCLSPTPDEARRVFHVPTETTMYSYRGAKLTPIRLSNIVCRLSLHASLHPTRAHPTSILPALSSPLRSRLLAL